MKIIKEKNEFIREQTVENSDHISLFMFQEQKPSFFLNILFESSYKRGKYSGKHIRDEINTTIIGKRYFKYYH
ncbi:cytochrome P450 4C1-like isoform X1 [Vespula maculifrons]|uniref:Cytochrome P450 4C1-like isoform X1 n=1 Tax=Vespula maculifrons TaxID=7453 RepID=A0ABD2CVU1_VESMC